MRSGEYICLTSSPVPASISRNRSTKVRTNFAAFALLTRPRNGRVVLINVANAKKIKNIHLDRLEVRALYIPFASLVSLKSLPRARIADSLIRIDSSSSLFTCSFTIQLTNRCRTFKSSITYPISLADLELFYNLFR